MGFSYVETKSVAYFDYDAEKGWSKGRLGGPQVDIHIMSNALHYGQAIFDGMKAFHRKDGMVSAFNPKENWERLKSGAERLGMPVVPETLFNDALNMLVKDNIEYVPPYGTGGSFYLRPTLFGHGAKLGLGVAPKYTFALLGCPVGNYYKGGSISPIDALVVDSDRAAPNGMGNVKAAGNYAADVKPAADAAAKGFPIALYLDAKTNSFVEEFSTSNFIGISKDGTTYVTPDSRSILPSITNKMLQQLAIDSGMKVEKRVVPIAQVGDFAEIGACGTAVIISPIRSITVNSTKYEMAPEFPVLTSLYKKLRSIQTGDSEDKHGWHRDICQMNT